MSIIKRNWRDVLPIIAHKTGIDWRLLSMVSSKKTHGDIEANVDEKFQCLKTLTYVSLAKLQPGLSYETHTHNDHEEIYYIISGRGLIIIDDEVAKFRDGDIIYIDPDKKHSIKNDGDEMVEFLAFGGLTN
ncbi:MAG: cupin domain-containing protein [Nitrososphaeraceae archaeon]